MPVIQNLASGGAPSPYRFSPLNLGQEPPAALPVDTSALSKAQAQAALMGTVAKTISDLPGVLLGNYVKGRQVGVQVNAQDTLNSVLNGTATPEQRSALAGTTITPEGVTYKGPGVLSDVERRDKEADIRYKTAHADYFTAGGRKPAGATEDNPLYTAFAPPDPTTGKVTSYGYVGDRFGGPGTSSATKNAMGGNLTENSMAVSPDVERQLVAAGHKIGDKVTFKLADGSTVTRTWDDRTAQWDPSGQWSVDDKGNKIPDGKGGFLPALHGRFDLPAVGGNPHPANGKQVVGIVNPVAAATQDWRQNSMGALADSPTPPAPTAPGALAAPPVPSPGVPPILPQAKGVPTGLAGPGETLLPDGHGGFFIQNPYHGPAPTAPATGALADPSAPPAKSIQVDPNPVGQWRPGFEGKQMGHPSIPGVFLDVSKMSPGTVVRDQPTGASFTVPPLAAATSTPSAPPAPGADSTALPVGGSPAAPAAETVADSPEAMMKAAGGKLLTEQGHAGGKVYQYPGFLKEETADGTTYLYPAKVKPGQKPFTVFKKPGAGASVPAQVKSEAIRMGVWKDNMSAEEASKAMEDKQITEGVIPPHLLPAAESMARFVVSHPALKHIPTIREAKEAVDAGLQNPDAGGFSDMALIEGFQRMVNPGATVRTQTMQNMKEAAGWLQQIDPSYQWNKATQGDKFTPQARERLKKLADDIYSRAMKNASPQMNGLKKVAKSYGISNPDQFIENVMVIAPMYDGAEPGATPTVPGAPGTPKAPAPAGSNMTAPAKVKTQEEYNSLPAGTWFIDGSGQLKQKGATKPAA